MRALWLVTYISILVLALISGLLCYGILSSQLRQHLAERNGVVLESIQKTIDDQLRTLDDSTYNITMDQEIQNILKTVTQPLDQEEKLKIYYFVKNLKYMMGWGNVEKITDSLMIYFPHVNLIMKQNTSHDPKSFYEVYLSGDRMSLEEWEKIVNTQHDGTYRIMDFYGQKNELFYIKTLYPTADKNNFINIIYKINKEQMMEMNRKLYLQEYAFFVVLDQNNQVMLELAPEPERNEFGEYDSILSLVHSKDVSVFKKVSEINSWQYLYILPEHIAYKSINDSRWIILLIFSVCLLMGLGLIVYFINLHYRPIRKMLSFFPDEEEDKRNNEYSFLEQQISSVLDKNEEINQIVDKQHSLLQTYLLNMVLTGQKLTEEKSRMEFECLNFNTKDGMFITFIMYAEPDEAAPDSQKERSYMHFVICNIMDEILTNLGYVFHSVEKSGAIVYITEIAEAEKSKDIVDAAEFAFEVIRSAFSFDFCCAFGSEHSGLPGIAESYDEARRVMEYCLSGGTTGPVTYSASAEQLSQSHFYSLEQEEKLFNLLKANEQTRLRQEIHEIFCINLQSKAFSLNALQYLTVDMFNTVKKALIRNGRTVDREFPAEVNFIDNIFKCNDTEQMEKTIQDVFCSCAQKLSSRQSTEDVVESVIMYIKENYANQNLSITMIADRFSMNHDYISRKFKEASGMRIGDYINSIRVERSKELLRDFNNRISNIAEMAGFSSYRTYVRTFTNVTGVTPKKYRDMYYES